MKQQIHDASPRGSVAGVVLAGGKSSRMGRDKATLTYQGKTMAQHMLDVLKEAGIEDLHLNNESGLTDIVPDKGPLGGIHSALQKLSDREHILFVPIDMPQITPQLINNLIQSASGNGSVFENYVFPLLLKVSDQLNVLLDNAVSNPASNSVRWLIAQLNISPIPIDDGDKQFLISANTPEEWKEITDESTF